jgi:hypothetical protein
MTRSDTYSAVSIYDVIPFTAAELTASPWVIRVLDESLDNSSFNYAELPFESVYATFNADGTGHYNQVLGNAQVNFTWEIQESGEDTIKGNFLVLDIPVEGNTNSTAHSLAFAQTFNRLGVRQATLAIDAPDFTKVNSMMLNTQVSLNATLAPVDEELVVADLPLVGRYASLNTINIAPNFFLQFDGDDTGFQESIDGTQSYTRPFSWQRTERGISANYYFDM